MKARGHFPTEQAALKHLYLSVISFDPTGPRRTRPPNDHITSADSAAATIGTPFSFTPTAPGFPAR